MKIKCAHTEVVPIGTLKPHPRNPNNHPEKQIRLLAKIIEAQGWRTPITVSRRSGYIVRGHGRYRAATLLKCEEVPIDFQDYDSDAQELADLLADNKIAEFSQLDAEVTRSLVAELATIEAFDMELAGFERVELKKILNVDPPQAGRD